MNIVALIIELVSGAVGGNIVGAASKTLDLGPVGNSIAGIIGGGLGGQLLGMMTGGPATPAGAAGGLDIGSILGNVAGGGVGGGMLMVIVGTLKQAVAKPS
jgi:hypothetical protein